MASYSMSPYEQPPGEGYSQQGGQSGANGSGKIFVGGLSPSVTSEGLIAHFSAYGEVLDATIMNDKITGRPRGFGFVTFRNPEAVDALMKDNHVLDGKQVECKRAVPMGYLDKPSGSGGPPSGPPSMGGGPRPISPPSGGPPSGSSAQPLTGRCNPEKIFVGGLPASCDDTKLREYFSKYGVIIDAVVMIDRDLQRHRGFGYVLFQDAGAVDGAVADHDKHQIDGKWVDVKRCIVQENSPWPAQSGPMRKGYGGKGGAMMAPMPGVSATMPGYYGAGGPATGGHRPTGYGGADYGTSSYYGGATAAGAYGKPTTAAAAYASRGMGPGKGAPGATTAPPTSGYGMGGYMTSAYGAPPQATSAYGYGPADPYATSGYGTSAYGAMPGYGAQSAYGGYGTSAYGTAAAASAYGTYGAPAAGAQPQAGSMQPPTSSGAANPNDLYAAGRRSGYRTSPY